MRKLKSISMLVILLLGLAITASQQKGQAAMAAKTEPGNSGITETTEPWKDTATVSLAEMSTPEGSVYDNPIDAYFLPRMKKQHICMVELRDLQYAYQQVWKDEFENLMEWMQCKCVYKEDKRHLENWKKSVEKNIKTSREVIITELLDVYEINPDPKKVEDHVTRVSAWGNGTVHYLKQLEGEIYRNAVMSVVNLFADRKYKFRDIDYSKMISAAD